MFSASLRQCQRLPTIYVKSKKMRKIMFTPETPVLLFESGVRGGQNNIGLSVVYYHDVLFS